MNLVLVNHRSTDPDRKQLEKTGQADALFDREGKFPPEVAEFVRECWKQEIDVMPVYDARPGMTSLRFKQSHEAENFCGGLYFDPHSQRGEVRVEARLVRRKGSRLFELNTEITIWVPNKLLPRFTKGLKTWNKEQPLYKPEKAR